MNTTLTVEHFQFEHQLEQAISSLLTLEGINSLNTTDREKRSETQAVLVKAEHASTDPHCIQTETWWLHDTYRMSIAISVMTVRQEAKESASLSAEHWVTVANVRRVMARRLNALNQFLNYHIAIKTMPTSSTNGIEENNIEATVLNFETVLKIK